MATIFLPAAGGFEENHKHNQNKCGLYYTATQMGEDGSDANYAMTLFFKNDWIFVGAEMDIGRRSYGQTVRPVTK